MIRELNLADLESLLDVVESLTDSQRQLNSHIQRNWLESEFAQAKLFGEETASLQSFAALRELEDQSEITFICRRNSDEAKGAGSRLLKFLQERAHAPLWLEVHEDNESAQRLYESHGFQQVGRREKYYQGQKTAILYTYSPS